MRTEPDTRPALDLADAATVSVLLAELLGRVPVLSVRVERDAVPVLVPTLPWPQHFRSVDVSVHCDGDEPAAEIAERIGLTLKETRRFASESPTLEFVDSTWCGWLTTSDAAHLGQPVSLTVHGAHLEPAPERIEFVEFVDGEAAREAVA